jgi:poly-gamma-glutamate synthesis protein (capsule biosynthesis protein)
MDRTLTIALTGDVMLGRGVNDVLAWRGPAYPWGDLLPTLRQADALLINLECALTSRTARWHDGEYKPFYFRSDPANVAALQTAGVSFASLANNHSLDYGAEGLLETIAVLDRAGIAHAGAGPDRAAARAPARLTVGGRRVAVVAFADYPAEWAAGPSAPGINYTPVSLAEEDFATVRAALADARAGADLVVFSIHWGPNMRLRPSPEFRAFARAVVAAGADVFWGHSAHVVQGIELWQGRPILYDSGDFLDDYAVDPDLRNDRSALFLLRVRPPEIVGLELLPVQLDYAQVNRARGADRAWIVERLAALCAEFGTALVDDGERLAVVPAEGTA